MLQFLRNVLSSGCAVAVVMSVLSGPVSAMITDDDDNALLVLASQTASISLVAVTEAPQVSSTTSAVVVAVQDVQFDNILHFLRTGPLHVVEEIVAYLDDQVRIDALYNAEVIPDSSADYKRNAIRKRLRPLIIKKIEDRVIESVLPSADSNVTKNLLRAEVKNFLHSEILSRKTEGELVNVCDLWMSGEVEAYFLAKAHIDEMPHEMRELSLALGKFKQLRRWPPLERIKQRIITLTIGYKQPLLGPESLPNIGKLYFFDSPMTSLKGFYKYRSLRSLVITRTPLASLEGLSETPLVDDIAFLRMMLENPLRDSSNMHFLYPYFCSSLISMIDTLDIRNTNITSLKGTERLLNLHSLTITHSPLASIEGIELMSDLRYVILANLPLNSLRGLEKLKWLKTANLLDLPNARDQAEVSRKLIRNDCVVRPALYRSQRTPLNYVFKDF